MKSEPPLSFSRFLRRQFIEVFSQPWPVIPSALVIAALNVFLFAYDKPWTASDGLRNWGDSLFHVLGVIDQPDLLSPLLYSGSVLNIGLLLGGFMAALLIRENGKIIATGQLPFMSACEAPPQPAVASAAFRLQPRSGVLVLVMIIGGGFLYQFLGHGRLAVFLLFGVVFGVVFQRWRWS